MAEMDLGGSVEAFGGDRGGPGAASGTGPSDGGGGGPGSTAGGIADAFANFDGPSQFTSIDASAIAASLVGPAFLAIALIGQPAATIAGPPGVGAMSLIAAGTTASAFAVAPGPAELATAFGHAAHDIAAWAGATSLAVGNVAADFAGVNVASGEPINLGYGAEGNITPAGVIGVRPSQPVDSGWGSGSGWGGSEGGFG